MTTPIKTNYEVGLLLIWNYLLQQNELKIQWFEEDHFPHTVTFSVCGSTGHSVSQVDGNLATTHK